MWACFSCQNQVTKAHSVPRPFLLLSHLLRCDIVSPSRDECDRCLAPLRRLSRTIQAASPCVSDDFHQ